MKGADRLDPGQRRAREDACDYDDPCGVALLKSNCDWLGQARENNPRPRLSEFRPGPDRAGTGKSQTRQAGPAPWRGTPAIAISRGDYVPPWPPSPPPGGRPPAGVLPPLGVDEYCEGAAGLCVLPAAGMLGRGAIGGVGVGVAGRGAGGVGAAIGLGAGGAMGLGAGGAMGLGAGGAMGLGAGGAIGLGAAMGLGTGGAMGLGTGLGAAAFGLATGLRAFALGFALALAFLAAGFLRAPFFATTRFFLRAAAVFFVFFVFLAFAFFDFLVFDFAFFAMIVLPIVSAQISVRLSVRLEHPRRADTCRAERGAPAPPYPSNPRPRRLRRRACWSSGTVHSTVDQLLPISASGLRPPVAQSISSTVWTTGIAVPAAI
jgi:hypothetical protein